MEYRVKILPDNKLFLVEDGTMLGEVLRHSGFGLPCGGRGICCNCHVEILSGTLPLPETQKILLERKGLSPEHWRLACCTPVTDDITVRIPVHEGVILSDEENAGLAGEEGYAVAVDLGSTTIVAQLLSRMDGKVLATQSEINAQQKYGADIISRIAYAMQSPEKLAEVAAVTRTQIGGMISALLAVTGPLPVARVVLVGNSAMHHLFCGIDPSPLATYPFQSLHNEACHFTGKELGWDEIAGAEAFFMPNISHFVGSDILAGILELGIQEKEEWSALIDLGTNGEIVIGHKGQLLCTSAAAGPAFEGVNITEGMRALSGAISSMDEFSGEVNIIGGVEPCGICGSGLIDAICYHLQHGHILPDGQIDETYGNRLPVAGNVHIYGEDIREFQLAKAAISTGFGLLLSQLGLEVADLQHIYVGGGLGNYLDLKKAVRLGLLQAADEKQLVKAGNSALSGCRKLAFDQSSDAVTEILSSISHFSLETAPDFQDRFCDRLFF